MKKQIKIETVVTNVKSNSKAILEMANVVDELRKSINRVANQNPKMLKGIQELTNHIGKLKSVSSDTTVKMGALSFVLGRVGDQAFQMGKSIANAGVQGALGLGKIATSFEYIGAGLNFAFGRKAEETMKKALDVAQETNIATREVLDATRALGVLKINPFSEMVNSKAQVQTALASMADLAALVPQQGMQGAMFAIRNALSGQWRSLQMRFDIPLNIIEDIRKNIESTMNTQQRFDTIMQGITTHFGGLMSSVKNTTQFTIDNIKDVFTNLMYDIGKEITPLLTPFFKKIEVYLKALRKDDKWIKEMGQRVVGITKSVMHVAETIYTVFKTLAENPFLTKLVITAGAIVASLLLVAGTIGKIASSLFMVKMAFGSASIAAKAFNVALASTGVGIMLALAGAITAVALNYDTAAKKADRFNKIKAGIYISGEEASQEYQNVATTLRDPSIQGAFGAARAAQKRNYLDPAIAEDKLTRIKLGNALLRTPNVDHALLRDLGVEAVDGKSVKLNDSFISSSGNRIQAFLRAEGLLNQALPGLARKTGERGTVDQGRAYYSQLYQDVSEIPTAREHGWKATVEAATKAGATPSQATAYASYLQRTAQGGMGDYLLHPQVLEKTLQGDTLPSFGYSPFKVGGTGGAPLATAGLAPWGNIYTGATDIKGGLARIPHAGGISTAEMLAAATELVKYTAGGDNSKSGKVLSDVFTGLTTKFRMGMGDPELRTFLRNPAIGGNLGNLKADANENDIRQAITNALGDKEQTRVLLEKISYLAGDMKKTAENTEDTAKNTRKVEELLPPIFREIFDKFTRRGMQAQMGRAAYLGAY